MNVLIVDDQLRSQMQMYYALRIKHNVQVAASEQEALELLSEKKTDVMLLDLDYPTRYPRRSSLHLAIHARKHYPELRVIGIYNKSHGRLASKVQNIGFHEFISRPIRNQLLMQVVSN